MNELSTTRTPEVIGVEIRTIQKSAFEYNLRCAVEIGRRLTEAKELVAHGEWLDWLKRETGYSQPSASRFMKVYERLGAEQIGLEGAELAEKYSMLNNLESSKIFLLVSMPEKDMDEFLDEHPVEELKDGTVNELKEAIRERDEARKALEEAKKDAERWEEKAGEYASDLNTYQVDNIELGKRIKELESRPVDVAVAEPDPAEIERRAKEIAEADIKAAVAEAEKKAAEEREKLQKKLEKAEAAKKKAEESAADAGSADKAEAEKLRTEAEEAKSEIERLRRRLAMSDAAVTTFKIHFESWQKAHAAMMEALGAVPAETEEKLRAAINAVIKEWEETGND